ncbi:MAG TPA: hypothetical protein VF267_06830 [Gammaproteobacteria bacterium]
MSATVYRSSNSYTSGVVLVVLAVIAFGIIGGNTYMVATGRSVPEHPMLAWAFIALFSLIPAGLLVLALKTVRARRIFGLLELHVAKAPDEDDGRLRSMLHVPRTCGVHNWQVVIRCRYWKRTGSQKNRRTHHETVWESEIPVVKQASHPGVFLRLEMLVPPHLPPTGTTGRDEGYEWDVVVRGRSPANTELLEEIISIEIHRAAVANKEQFAVEELAQETAQLDNRSHLTDADMQLGSEHAWFAEHLWSTPADRKKYRFFITAFLCIGLAILLFATRDDFRPVLHGAAVAPVAALLLYTLMKLRLLKSFVLIGLVIGGFGLAAYFRQPETFFTAFILVTFTPFVIQAWFGLDRFELHLTADGIRKAHARGIGKSDETIAWNTITGISVHDGKANAIRRKEMEKTGQFTVIVEHATRTDVSPPFKDADDAVSVVEWLERWRQRYL